MRFTIEKIDRFAETVASDIEAAFLLSDTKSEATVRVLHFRTLKQMDAYQATEPVMPIRNLPVLIEGAASEGLLKRMADWYYYTQLNPDK